MIETQGPDHGLKRLSEYLACHGAIRNSRNGRVRRIVHPVLICHSLPQHYVLRNENRNANPFYHLYEGLWMLAGENKLHFLTYYNKRMTEFSDDNKTLNGAYGARWRRRRVIIDNQLLEVDQLNAIISHLLSNRNSRRAVLQIWDVRDDLLRIDSSKDIACNDSVVFQVRADGNTLDMTVRNRSNDLIWGLMGADYVHFCLLFEYMADCLEMQRGCYYHFTNDLHAYEDTWDHDKIMSGDTHGPIQDGTPRIRLVENKGRFDEEVKSFITSPAQFFEEPFLECVAKPMMLAYSHQKQFHYNEAYRYCQLIVNHDWRDACTEWIKRAEKRRSHAVS